MYDKIREMVIETLQTHNEKLRKIDLLRYELYRLHTLSGDEVIESMALGSNLFMGRLSGGGRISDKTMAIALKYSDTRERLVDESATQISIEIQALEDEISRIEHYISLLPEKFASVIRLFYFDGMQNAQIAEVMSISTPTVVKWKHAAIKEIVSMYEFMQEMKV